MPQQAGARQPLTEQEFQAVLDRAVKTAPAGLSEAEFDNYVAQAASRDEAARDASQAPAAATLKGGAGDVLSGFLGSLLKVPAGIVEAASHPIDTVKGLVTRQLVDEPMKAFRAGREGRYSEAAGHVAASLIPIVGPAAADVGEKMAATGNIGEGVGEGIALAGMSSPSAIGKTLSVTGRGMQRAADIVQRPSRYAGAGAMIGGHPVASTAILASPYTLRGAGRALEGAGSRISGAVRAVSPTVTDSLKALLDYGTPDSAALDAAHMARRVRTEQGMGLTPKELPPRRMGGSVQQPVGDTTPPLSVEDVPRGPHTFAELEAERMAGAPPEFQTVRPRTTIRLRQPVPDDPVFAKYTARGSHEPGPHGYSLDDVGMAQELAKIGYSPEAAAKIATQGSPLTNDAIAVLMKTLPRTARQR